MDVCVLYERLERERETERERERARESKRGKRERQRETEREKEREFKCCEKKEAVRKRGSVLEIAQRCLEIRLD